MNTGNQVSSLKAEIASLRARLARAKASEVLAISAARDLQHVRHALAAGGVVGTWSWHPTRDSFSGDLGFTVAFGLDPSFVHKEVPIDSVLKNVHPEDRSGLDVAIMEAVARGGTYRHQYRVKRADGLYYWLDANGSVGFDQDGQPVSFPGFVVDITEQRAAAERLRISEENLRESMRRVQLALAAGAIIGTWDWDLPTDRFKVDEAFANAFGLDPALGREGIPLAQIVATVHPDDQERLAKAIEEAIVAGSAFAQQYRVRRSDGQYYWLEANGRVDHAPDGTPLSFPGVLIDMEGRRSLEAERDLAITELHRLNETLEQHVAERSAELMKTEEKLRQSQKMEAVGQLTGGLAHDFNNLLAGISGSLELMQARLKQNRITDVERYIKVALHASKRAADLTHRLLAFSRRQTLDPKPTDVGSLVDGMHELIQRSVGPAISLQVQNSPDLWVCRVDASQLENALLNLCINARDAMPKGGSVLINTANKYLDKKFAEQHQIAEGQYLSLCVKDTGTGMSPQIIARAFEPFFTTKPTGAGTGLGLSMIYGFAKQSGGLVQIHSELGQGTTVCIYLPRDHAGIRTEPTHENVSSLSAADLGATVLVLDDEPSVRLLITDVLKDLGYSVIEAEDGVAGLKILQSDMRIDLLVTDVGLPGGLNGRQVADAARVFRPDLKVLFITGYAESAVLGSRDLAPGMVVLVKPFPLQVLATHIDSLISGCGNRPI